MDGHLQNVLQTASGDWFTRSMRVCYLPGKARMADTDPGLRLFLDSFFSFSLHGYVANKFQNVFTYIKIIDIILNRALKIGMLSALLLNSSFKKLEDHYRVCVLFMC